eukprot:407648-Pyramimonas_sp.AAC.1
MQHHLTTSYDQLATLTAGGTLRPGNHRGLLRYRGVERPWHAQESGAPWLDSLGWPAAQSWQQGP